MDNTITGNGNLNISNGASLGLSPNISNVENSLNFNNATFDMSNDSISSTTFYNMTLTGNNLMEVDVDVVAQSSDKIKFNNPTDLIVNPGASLNISNVNLMNANKAYTNEKYYVPFISNADNNQNLLGAVSFEKIWWI